MPCGLDGPRRAQCSLGLSLPLCASSFWRSTSSGSSPPLRPENMVHHTMNTNNTSAPSASSNNKVMGLFGRVSGSFVRVIASGVIVGSLVSCAVGPVQSPAPRPLPIPSGVTAPVDAGSLPPAIQRGKSRWTPVPWSDLPGWGQDSLHEAWNAWVRGCERPAPGQAVPCAELRQLAIGTPAEQQAWVMRRFQPYRVTEPDGSLPDGLLTGYYEPIMAASRVPTATHRTPLYAPPANLPSGQPWYSRQEIDTLPAAQAALQGRALAWLADPIDALILQIQGSGRLNLMEADGRTRQVRLAFAAHNGQPYQSVVAGCSTRARSAKPRGPPSRPGPRRTRSA